ncbi:mevalonate kinase [Nitrincola alkalilacustris]|uniref:mevalonate kinase family protein n=1 Tax=Nitrincola alkalilacustris TaxID=1571224 RepID=UPI00124BEB8E|nr:mevalonate kinase [Nitrincola alkalilacustris]
MPAAVAPGKIILSGEHSVVYGAPALAVAVRQHIRIDLLPGAVAGISWRSPKGRLVSHDAASLQALVARLDQHHQQFLEGNRAVESIMSSPEQLLFYAIAQARRLTTADSVLDSVLDSELLTRSEMIVDSTLPLGAGMGSSAALVAAALVLFGQHLDMTHEQRIELAHAVRHCERLQHGRGSLIDAAAVCCGGRVRLKASVITPVDGPGLGDGWFWINTGSPVVSTGVCVEAVRTRFADDQPLWDQFAVTTEALIQADTDTQRAALVQENHRLLQHIGVVPSVVSAFVEQLEAHGGAGKISGAGSVRGEAGGLLLAWLPQGDPGELAMPQHWRWGKLEEETQGVSYIGD